MKKLIIQYLWLIIITFILLTLTLELTKPKKDPLEEVINKAEKEGSVLTESEKVLKEKAFQKEWEETDKDTNK